MIWKYVRTTWRLARFLWAIAGAVVDYFLAIRFQGKASSVMARAEWLQRHSQRVMNALNVHVERHGPLPPAGLLAANHLGYLDVLVLGAAQPMVFLSKSEVRRWPVVGWLTSCAGTLFIRRDKKSDVARFDDAFADVIRAGAVVGIFPEGTSTDGHRVLPFHSSLFGSAAAAGWPVTPAWIGYQAQNGSVENDVCYWGDMTFFSHFFRLIAVERIDAVVVYGERVAGEPDRKQIARVLHRRVCDLFEQHRPELSGGNGGAQNDLVAAAR